MGRGEDRSGRRRGRAAFAWPAAGAVMGLVVGLDQLVKAAIRSSVLPGEEQRFLPGVELVNTRNHGVAFGFLPGSHTGVTVLIGIALCVLLGYFAMHATLPLVWLPTGMLMGGATGNILDRVRSGSVTDFIKLPLGWPPFNVADMAITIGVILLALLVGRAAEQRS